MADISASVFYGDGKCRSNSKVVTFHQKLRKIEEKSKLFKDRPLIKAMKESSFAPHHIWEVFPTQIQALEYATRCRSEIEQRVAILSREFSNDGKRQFIVTALDEFWRRYKKIPPNKRNFYELIEEGMLCRLYFDVEFYKAENINLNGSEMLDTLIDLICFYLQERFKISCERGNIIDLDSSTPDKFSRHLIFHLPMAVFSDNIECGNFVSYIYEMTRRKVSENGSLDLSRLLTIDVDPKDEIRPPDGIKVEQLFVNNKDGNKTFFADLGVYTKNRNFRLFGSTKFGKNAHLKISSENGFHGSYGEGKKLMKDMQHDAEYLFFLDTLVCYHGKISNDITIVSFASANKKSALMRYSHFKQGNILEIIQ